MDILLSHGYFLLEDEHERQIMKPYPPLGLMYLSSYLKSKGFNVELYDATFSTMADFEAYMERTRPGLVGLYANLMTKQNILKQIRVAKRLGAAVVLGGSEPVSYAAAYLQQGADIVVSGEGELTLEELIPHLAQNGLNSLSSIQGLIFRDQDGRLARSLPRQQIEDLSLMPWPDRAAVDMEQYLATWKTHHGLSSISLITARGCPYTCKWCSHSVFGHTHRRRTPEDVVEEVTWIAERYNPDQLWYADDVFTIHPRWFLKFAGLLRRRGLKIPFECISRADRLTEEVVRTLADMGCYRLWIGAESGSQRILDAMDRRTDAEDVLRKSRLLQASAIEVGMFIMLGYEGEEIRDIEATADFLKQLSPDLFLTTVAYPIKDTDYFRLVEDRISSPQEWPAITDRDLLILGRHSRRFYNHTTRWLVSEVNLHKARRSDAFSFAQMAKLWLNAKRGRLGMYLARNEREGQNGQAASGRGWQPEDRATSGW